MFSYLALMFLQPLEWYYSTGLPKLLQTGQIPVASEAVWSCGLSPNGPQFYTTNQKELGPVSVSGNNENTCQKKRYGTCLKGKETSHASVMTWAGLPESKDRSKERNDYTQLSSDCHRHTIVLKCVCVRAYICIEHYSFGFGILKKNTDSKNKIR